MLAVFKNNWNRILEEKSFLIMSTVLTICSIVAAIVLTNKVEIKQNIAVVGGDVEKIECPYLDVTNFTEAPKDSCLAKGRYDAIIFMDGNRVKEIKTFKSDEIKQKIKQGLEHPESAASMQSEERKLGTNIIGYMMMFLLMQGIMYGRLFGEEKEKHMAERVTVSPIPFREYLLGHGVFIFSLIFIPSFLVLCVADLFGISIGLSLLSYAGILALLSMIATSFSLFINSLFHVTDTANMIGNASIILTTILSGSFYSMLKSGSVLEKVLHVLPQKDLLAFVNDLESNMLKKTSYAELIYAILIAVVFLTAAIYKTRKEYVSCQG